MTKWTLKNYHKKNIEEYQYFVKNEETIICKTNWRWGAWSIETSDNNPPHFEFTYLPGGDGNPDSIDMNNCIVNNIENVEMIETFDGGWDLEYPNSMSQDEQDKLQERINEEGLFTVLEDEEGYYLSDTECWVWGPLEILDENDNRVLLIIADENGNIVDYKDDE